MQCEVDWPDIVRAGHMHDSDAHTNGATSSLENTYKYEV